MAILPILSPCKKKKKNFFVTAIKFQVNLMDKKKGLVRNSLKVDLFYHF